MSRSKISTRYILILLMILGSLNSGCGNRSLSDWSRLIPDKTPFLIVPEENSSLSEILEKNYIPVFEDISTSAVQFTGELQMTPETELPVKVILLYPDTSNDWQPVWVTEAGPELLGQLKNRYQKPFAQNRYFFKDYTIEKLFISNRIFFAVRIGPYTVFSESSLGIEDMLRSYLGELPTLHLADEQPLAGSYIVNTPQLDRWVQQLAQVSYRPSIKNAFDGGTPVSLRPVNNNPDEINQAMEWRLSGTFQPTDSATTLIRSLSSPARTIGLDHYISSNVAAFYICHLEPRTSLPLDIEPDFELDRYLYTESQIYQNIASTLGDELAFAAFAESGFMSSSEFLFLRDVHQPESLRNTLNQLESEDLLTRDGNIYTLRSRWLGRLFGSELAPIENFYLGIYDEAVVISRSKGLTESVGSDSERRRVIFYEDQYTQIRNQLPERLSSLLYVNSSSFNSYIQPWLFPQNYFSALSTNFEILTLTTETEGPGQPVRMEISSFQQEVSDVPYRDQWIFSLNGAQISGPPVLENIGGTPREEIIFSTHNNSVYALAADGTIVTQTDTNDDQPVGSPVVFDWYGNNQNVILQAAGNKIYAWNETGSLLPNFPVVLSENITTPLQILDITRNGIAEILVGTADRNFHILNSRGDPIAGWPQKTNTVVTTKPLVQQLGQQRSIFAFAENSLHAWNINGSRRAGFPVFIDSQFNGSPANHEEFILGAAADGHLYSIGEQELFADSLAASVSGDSLIIQGVNVSNSSLNTTPSVQNQMIRVDDELVRENLILLQSSNGSVFLLNSDGQLRFAQNMGQPGSGHFPPVLTDLNSNGRTDVVALADFGRLYAWDLISGDRNYDLPTTGMRFPVIFDLNRDGNKELIGQTREGLQTWTIFK